MYTFQISLERVAINKIVTSSSPGGQWLPFRGRDAVPSLSHPIRTSSFITSSEVVGSNTETPEKIFISNLLRENYFIQILLFQVDQFSFNSRAVPNFFPSTTCYKSFLYLTYFRYFSHRSWMMYLTIFLLSLPVFLSSVESFETSGKPLNFFLHPSFKYPNSLHGGAA